MIDLASIKAAAESLESLFTIGCGRCGKTSPALEWREAAISGALPDDRYQCPACRQAYIRVPFTGDPFRKIDGEWRHQAVDLVPVDPCL